MKLLENYILENLAVGYTNADLIGDKILPLAKVGASQGQLPAFGKEHFRTYNTLRAENAQINLARDFNMSGLPYELKDRNLAIPYDLTYNNNSGKQIVDAQKHLVRLAKDNFLLSLEKERLDLVQDTNQYLPSNKVTFASNFFNLETTDPIKSIQNMMDTVEYSLLGRTPNKMVMNSKTFKAIRDNPHTRDYFINGIGGNAIPKVKDIADILGLEEIIIARSSYTADDNTFTELWGNKILLFYSKAPTGVKASVFNPNFGYTLWNNNPEVKWITLANTADKVKAISYSQMLDLKITGNVSGYLISNPIEPNVYSNL